MALKKVGRDNSHGAAMIVERGRNPAPRLGNASPAMLARAQVSRQLSHRLPYYLTPEEAHQLIDAAENERDHLFLRFIW